MSSWLGGLGSGLGQVGGSLSSLTGQLSSFTKDILLEGTEEVTDAETELKVSNSRLAELEATCSTQKSEYERLRKIHVELEEKHEAAEIQMKQQSAAYRNMLQQKEVEISHMKARQSGLLEELHKLQHSANSTSAVLQVNSSSAFLPETAESLQGFQGDEMDFGDVIWSQQEINRLSRELSHLQDEVAHWKELAQASKTCGESTSDQGEILRLQKALKELRSLMEREVDEHQHELAALQDAQQQKLSEITRRHREELAEYDGRIEELEEQIQDSGSADSPRQSELQAKICVMQEDRELQDQKLRELMDRLVLLQKEKEEVQLENGQLLHNYTRLQSSVEELQTRVTEQQGKVLQKSHMDTEIQTLRKALIDAEKEISNLKSLSEVQNKTKTDVEHADILELNMIIAALQNEKSEIEKEKFILQERVRHMEQTSCNVDQGTTKQLVKELKKQLEGRDQVLREAQEDKDTLRAELEELDHQNQEATQHMILLKEQLGIQRKEAEATASLLQSQLHTKQEKEEKLQEELKDKCEKLSQSAFALNDLHISKKQLDLTVNELQSNLKKAQEHNRERQKELNKLEILLQEKEQELLSARKELVDLKEKVKVEDNNKELMDLRKELAEMRCLQDTYMTENYNMKLENKKLKSEVTEVTLRLEDLGIKVQHVNLEKDAQITALKLEKSELENDLRQLEKQLFEQSQHYQQTIDELTKARSLDSSALQKEYEHEVKRIYQKDLTISELQREMRQMAADHRDTNDMLSTTVAEQTQLTELLSEKEALINTLKAKMNKLHLELDQANQVTNGDHTMRNLLEEKDKQLSVMKEENSHLKEEMDRLRDQQSRPHHLSEPRTLDIITELETEVAQLKAKRDGLIEELSATKTNVEEQRESFILSLQAQQNELEQARSHHQQNTLSFQTLIKAKDEELVRLQGVIDQLSEQQMLTDSSPPQPVVIMQEDKTQSLNGENGSEKHDLSKVEIEKLVKGIKEKESEIILLNEKNLSLIKQLDQLVVSRDEVGKLSQVVRQKELEIQALHARVSAAGHSQDVLFLQQQLQAYAVEREQVLAVLNEKTRENSQLRSDYHRLMDIVAGKEAALLKLQQENQRLSTMADPSGSQEMFRETIQNLSRIIREKDIEIDALSQKCQTLVTVLQTAGTDSASGSGGGISSNQFEELLQERNTLKQQVKKMEEWKQQVITTVKNMQHESAQLQEELIKLQGQVSVDSDCNSKLSDDYAKLIHCYEQKQRKLECLSQELAQVLETISQLSSTRDVLLEKLDLVPQSSVAAVCVEKGVPEKENNLKRELEHLEGLVSEKERTICSLQKNNSVALAAQTGQAQELRLMQDKLDSLHKSLREKDLLIKSKGDQLIQVSESLRNRENDNEVLKQAVTNLKERTLILELDIRKLKEENERVASKTREKETEFRALQETNMQLSLLLKEKEFESTAMREKAAAMEKVLKDGEQGKSGELNQLLNEVRSMQEKAVAFQQERDQVMLALKQKQMETSSLQSELQHMCDKEQRLKLELERLRSHLLEIEDSYTREALAAEDREAELRKKVALLDEKLQTSSSAVESASQQASLQVESLQEQLSSVVRQRNESLAQLHKSQEQVAQYAVSLSNLQMVLEQFQQDEKAMYSAELEKHMKEKTEWKRKAEHLEQQVSALQINLDEACAALESASRLTDQLDHKEEVIAQLKEQAAVRQEMLEEAQSKLMHLLNSTEGKVDKVLIQNLFVGYFHTPKTKRPEVLRLMGSVLGLTRDEVEKLLQEQGTAGVTGWVSSWLGSRAVQSVPNTPQRPGHPHKSSSTFSQMFVKFLEVESSPASPVPRLPMYDMQTLSVSAPVSPSSTHTPATGGSSKRTADGNPFLAPRSAAVPLMNPGVPGLGGGSRHLLMKPISDTLPTFTPVPVCGDASAGAVLKDLLKQ